MYVIWSVGNILWWISEISEVGDGAPEMNSAFLCWGAPCGKESSDPDLEGSAFSKALEEVSYCECWKLLGELNKSSGFTSGGESRERT